MKVGISTASLYLRKPNEEAVSVFSRLKIPTSEVFLTSFSEYDPAFAKTLVQNKGEVAVCSLHVLGTQFEPQLFCAQPRVRQDAYFWLARAMEAGKTLGASYYTFHGIPRMKRAAREGQTDNFPALGKSLEEISEFCLRYGITLSLENVEWATYHRPGVFQRIKEYCPSLHGVLDIKQARLSRYPYPMYLNEMGERITHVHVSDVDEQGHIRLPGQGIFDFTELVKRLKDVGFDGALLIEVYKDDYLNEEELKQSEEYLQEIIAKIP